MKKKVISINVELTDQQLDEMLVSCLNMIAKTDEEKGNFDEWITAKPLIIQTLIMFSQALREKEISDVTSGHGMDLLIRNCEIFSAYRGEERR